MNFDTSSLLDCRPLLPEFFHHLLPYEQRFTGELINSLFGLFLENIQAEATLNDEQEFLLSLAKLIANNLYVHTWLFKIDDEFNGRGHAYLNIDQVRPLSNLRKKPIQVGNGLIE